MEILNPNKIRLAEKIRESPHQCLLLIEIVSCNGRCNSCSEDYLRSRRSAVGAC